MKRHALAVLSFALFSLLGACTSAACDRACTLIVRRAIQCEVLVTPDEQGEIDACSGSLGAYDDASCTTIGDRTFNESCEDVAKEFCPGEQGTRKGPGCIFF